jgi:N-acetylglucosamine-6-phosphate deacetylase
MKGAHNQTNIVDPRDANPLDVSQGGIYAHLNATGGADSGGADSGGGDSDEKKVLVTLAPELPGSLQLIKTLTDNGMSVSLGHTNATYDEALAGVTSGATLLTHLYNQMTPFHHRNPGLLPLLTLPYDQRPYYSIISDGIHVSQQAVKLAHCLSKKCVLVSDAMSGLGLEDGVHKLGEIVVEKKGGKAVVSGTDVLAGSVCTLDDCFKNFLKFTECSFVEGLKCVTVNPAAVVGSDKIGRLDVGCYADLCLMTTCGEIRKTWKRGELVFEK